MPSAVLHRGRRYNPRGVSCVLGSEGEDDAGPQVPGRIDVTSGAIEADELAKAGVDDMLDDLGEIVLRADGQLVVVPAEQMPTSTGVAAIYRY